MKKILVDDSDRIIVRKGKLARCSWCGSPESNKWIPYDDGRLFCTEECMTAATVRRKKLSAAVNFCCGAILLFSPLLVLLIGGSGGASIGYGLLEFLIYGMAALCVGVGFYMSAIEGKKKIPG